MHRKTLTWSIVVLAAATSMWACGSDDDGGPDGSGGTTAGSGGRSAGGAGAHAGTGGNAKGGSGNAGHGNAGSANGGSENAGEGGVTQAGGAGGDSAVGGAGGDKGEGGNGGEAGGGSPPPPTLAENCAKICVDQSGLSCAFTNDACTTACIGLATDTAAPDDYPPMIACEALHLTAADYECSDMSPAPPAPAPKGGTSCETLICKWTCADATFVDPNVYARCGC